MSQPYLGQIRPFGFNFAPKHWAQCDGQLLSIQQNAALFALLGITYGGDGSRTFALPDLRGRIPVHDGSLGGTRYNLGDKDGVENVLLNGTQLPAHNHLLVGQNTDANTRNPVAGVALCNAHIASGTPDNYYATPGSPQPLNAGSIGPAGQGQPHGNMQPYLAVNWCIAMSGVFPSRN